MVAIIGSYWPVKVINGLFTFYGTKKFFSTLWLWKIIKGWLTKKRIIIFP